VSPWIRIPRIASLALLLVCLIAGRASAQAAAYERSFPNPRAQVDKAIQELRPSASGKLPILDGFVGATDQPLDRYTRGFYQCELQVKPDSSAGTTVQVTAKITAWYSDPSAAKSGYQVLPSNGRLESDLLDRLEELLGKKGASPATSRPATVNSPPARATAPVAPSTAAAPPLDPSNYSSSNKTAPSLAPPPVSAVPSAAPADPALNDADLNSLRQKRGEAERRIAELNGEIQNLQEILKSQSHPNDLASVKKSLTPVFSKPQSTAAVLFSADAEDEFQILDKEGDWIHVQLSGVSRGWIRRSQLELPEAFADADPKDSAAGAGAGGGTSFRVAREETHPFEGQWQPLHGKNVRLIWVEPSSAASSAEAKRNFAKSLFFKAAKDAESDATVAGIVIVFDSADGGQMAATLENVKQWQAGTLPEAAFWKQCSLDPPELLQESDHP